MLSRRTFLQTSALTLACVRLHAQQVADHTLTIAPYTLEYARNRFLKTIAYNQQIPGSLLRLRQGQTTTVDIVNKSPNPEILHWHGLDLPPELDGAMEEGTPHIGPGETRRITFRPNPTGFRWFHTHTMAGHNMNLGMYTGQHGLLMIEPSSPDPVGFDKEFFLALHDWRGRFLGSDDGAMEPVYSTSSINGRTLGFNEPLRVKQGDRVLFHLLNSSATATHWLSLPGHSFRVVSLDGNPVPKPTAVPMLRIAPAERICCIVEMSHPGVWILGEPREQVRSAGMGIVVEYTSQSGKPIWSTPENQPWDYSLFSDVPAPTTTPTSTIPIRIDAKFMGHGSSDHWQLNGKEYPQTSAPALQSGQAYRLLFDNRSDDDHPLHLHRHLFTLRRIGSKQMPEGIVKDTVLVPARTQVEVDFVADNPGNTLLHCHQQAHMDMGFMLLFRYA